MRIVAFSLAAALALAGSCQNRAPSIPIVFGPTAGRPGDSLVFTARSVDADADQVAYRFDWGDGDTSDWGGWMPPGEEFPARHAFADTGHFEARAAARDAGRESEWSDAFVVNVQQFRPTAPLTPSGPDTVSVGDSLTFLTRCYHPLGEMVSLRFDWGDTLGDWTGWVEPGESVERRHAYAQSGLNVVRAQARDVSEYLSDWSRPSSLYVVDTVDRR